MMIRRLVFTRSGCLLISAGLLMAVTTPTLGQMRPDFSGVWRQAQTPPNQQRGAASGTLGSGWGTEFLITQVGSVLTIERQFFTRSDIQPSMKFRYALDGGETTNSVFMGRGLQEQHSTATWLGDTLMITTTHPFTNPETGMSMTTQVTHRLSLTPSRLPAWPPSLVIETTRAGVLGGPSSSTRTVYTRT